MSKFRKYRASGRRGAALLAALTAAAQIALLSFPALCAAEEAAPEAAAAEVTAEAATDAAAAEGATSGAEAVYPDRSVVRTNGFENWPQAYDIRSDYGCLMDATTGAVLFDKGEHEPMPPASLTKIMTVLLALENGDLDAQVTMTQTGVDYAVDGSSNLYTQVGEVFTLRDMLYGVLLKSANDMATQVGEYIGGGSLDNFLAMMNTRAAELGCRNTHFANACGMPNEEHVTTAYDLCMICKEALKHETFLEILGTRTYTIPATNMNGERVVENHHPFVTYGVNYEGFLGGKTGYTDASLNTLATIAKRSTTTLIAVTLHGAGTETTSADAVQLLDYGFDNFKHVRMNAKKYLVEGGIISIPKDASEDVVTSSVEEGTNPQYGDVVVTSYKFSKHLVGTTIQEKSVVEELRAKEEAKKAEEAAKKAAAEAAAAASLSAAEAPAAPEATVTQIPADYRAGEPAEISTGGETVTLPFGITMNRTAFIAIAALSLLILLGILIIIITLLARGGDDYDDE